MDHDKNLGSAFEASYLALESDIGHINHILCYFLGIYMILLWWAEAQQNLEFPNSISFEWC